MPLSTIMALEALAASTQARSPGRPAQPQRGGETGVAVRQHQQFLPFWALLQASMTKASLTDMQAMVSTPLALILSALTVARQVGDAAAGGERARYREQQYLLAGKDGISGDIGWAFFAHGFQGAGRNLCRQL